MNRSTTIRSPVNRRGFATKALLLGVFVGGGVAVQSTGVVWIQVVVAATAAVVIAGGVYLLLWRLAAWVPRRSGAAVSAETGPLGQGTGVGNKQPAADGGQE